jgi:hypothetical protein
MNNLSTLFFTLFVSLTLISTTIYAEETAEENAFDVFQTAIESSSGEGTTLTGSGIISDLTENTTGGGYTATVTSTQTGSVNPSSDKVFSEFSGEVKSWFSGSLGYLIALFAFTGTVIIYAFTHRHGVLFIGFLISFLAGAGPTLAGLSHSMGAAMSGPIPGGCGNTAIGGIILKGNLCYEVTRKEGSACLGQIVNPSSCGVVSSDGTITYSTSQQVPVTEEEVTATIESLTANLVGEGNISTIDNSYSSLTDSSDQLRRLQILTALSDANQSFSSYNIGDDTTYEIMDNLNHLNDSSFAQLMSAMSDDSADWDTTLTNVAVQTRSSAISMGDASSAFNEKISSTEDNSDKMKVLTAVEELYSENSNIDATLASDYISVADSITSADFGTDKVVQSAIVTARTTNITTDTNIDSTKLVAATSGQEYAKQKEILDIAQNMSDSNVLELSNNTARQEVIYSIVNHDSFTEKHAEVLSNIINGYTGDYDGYTYFATLVTTNTDSDSTTEDIDIATLFTTGALFEVEVETEEEVAE